jgi:hypothetical protein
MRVKIRQKYYDLTEEELEFVKMIYGYWEEENGLLVFEAPKMIPMKLLCKELGITRQAVHQRHEYNPEKYPLHRMGRDRYIFDWELDVWKTNRKKQK